MSDDALYPFLKELGKEQWPKRHPQRKHIPFFQSFRAAMSSSVVDEFIEANAKYAASFTKGSLPLPPGRKVAGAYSRSAWLYPLGGGGQKCHVKGPPPQEGGNNFLPIRLPFALPWPPSSLPRHACTVLACMDARLDVAKALGLEEGDAHVIRNAGGIATDDAIRSLTISQRLLGKLDGSPCAAGFRTPVAARFPPRLQPFTPRIVVHTHCATWNYMLCW